MPSCKDLFAAAGRFGPGRLTLPALLLLAVPLAFADHGVPGPSRAGFGWMSWLLVAGAVIAVALAAWAFFAPDRADGPSEPPTRDGSLPKPPRR
jgi:hypothetical protein